MRCGDSEILLDYIYLQNIVRNTIVASRFHHSVCVQLLAFDILFVLYIARRQSEVRRQ